MWIFILIYILTFIAGFIAMFIVSIFSSEKNDWISILLATLSVWGLNTLLSIFGVSGILGLGINIIVTMIIFIKFLGFEPFSSFFASIIFSLLYYFTLIFIFSSIYYLFSGLN